MDPALSARTDPPAPADDRLKAGALGATGITAMVVAAAAPLTVMAGIAPLAISTGGIGAPAGYLGAAVVLALFAVGFTTTTRLTGGAGAFYSCIALGLGRTAGAGAGLLAVVSYNVLQIGVYGLLGVQFQAACARSTGIELPWWVFALAAIAVVWALGRRGIDVGAKVLGVLLAAETAILALLVVGVVAHGGHDGLHLTTFTPSALSHPGLLGVLGFCFAAFAGFESTALYRREARDPDRSIPRATYAAVAFLGLFYAVVVWAVVQAVGDADAVAVAGADPVGLFFTVIGTYVGPWAAHLMDVFVLTSVMASQTAFHNAANRYTFTLARDGLLPAGLARTHPRFASPARAGTLQTLLAAAVVAGFALVGADPYRQLVLLVNTPGAIGVLLLQAVTSVAVVAHLRRHRSVHPLVRWTALAATVLLGAALVVLIRNIGLLTGAGTGTNAVLVVLVPLVFGVGVVLARVLRARRPDLYTRIGGNP
ncbi:APC family permease [Kineococcus sp. SYSU DK001]|uniref:APC family permease n=1 Tax=Kineococcus sp. SYSU DK001 TaxID=3383122 RepID=UPI003D7EBB51